MAGLNDHRAPDWTPYEPDGIDHHLTTTNFSPLFRPVRIAITGAIIFGVSYLVPPEKKVENDQTYPISAETGGMPDIGSAQVEAMFYEDADALPPGTPLFGRRTRFSQPDGGHTDILAEKSPVTKEVRLEIDGETYAIDDNPLLPGVKLGTVIDSATINGPSLTFVSEEYGVAVIGIDEIRRMLKHAAACDGEKVTLTFDADFTPKPGSCLETIIATKDAAKREYERWTGKPAAASTMYTLTLTRQKQTPGTLAYIDNHLPDGVR